MMRTILAIDPSTTSMGWATATDCGHVKAKGLRPARLWGMHQHLYYLIERVQPNLITYYRPFARGADATRCAWGIVGILEAIATYAKCPVQDVPEGTVRKHFKFPTRLDRDALKNFSINLAKSMEFGPENDDEADACLLWAWSKEHMG